MADTITLRVDHFDSPFGRSESTATVPTPTATADAPLTSVRIERLLDGLSGAEVTVRRSDWVDILPHVTQRDDKLFLEKGDETVFGGRLDGWQFDGEFVSVQLNDFEIDALTARPVGNIEEGEEPFGRPAYPYDGVADDVVVADLLSGDASNEAVPGVPTLSPGTVDTVSDPVSVTESFAYPGDLLRSLTEQTGARLRYNADQTVDYRSRLGVDRTEPLTSAALIRPPRIRSESQRDYTRIFVYNPSLTDDPSERSQLVEFLDGERDRIVTYRRQTDAPGTFNDSDSIASTAEQVLEEVQDAPSQLLIEATVDPTLLPVSLRVDDTVPVDIPEYRIFDERLRVTERRRRLGGDGDELTLKLENRRFTSPL